MRKRPLGQTGLEVSELALGTWGLSGDAYGPVADVDRVLDRAVQLGITLFDTADAYGNGEMERKLGKRIPAKTTHVITKIGTNFDEGYPTKDFDKGYLRTAFERSRDRLKRDAIDVVLLHNPSVTALQKDEPFELMESLKNKGSIIAWGVAAGSAAVARAAIERGAEVIELAYNCFFADDVHDLLADFGLGPRAEPKEDTEDDAAAQDASPSDGKPLPGLIARSVLAHGLLAAQWSAEREFYPGDHRAERWNQDELRRRVGQLNALRPLAGGEAPTIRAVAVRYVLSNEHLSSAVLGPRSAPQLDQLVREAGRKPPYLSAPAMGQLQRRLTAVGIPQ